MPAAHAFDDSERYYGTLFHELAHSTGHESRLDRPFGKSFGDDLYSREELIAEMTSAMLAGVCGFADSTYSASASYLDSWIRALKGDSRLVVDAATRAQKAADWILGEHPAIAQVDQAA
ncbi:MAG: zincin-like metallopeptidase domain-containing protein [Acidobacteriota bacterium]